MPEKLLTSTDVAGVLCVTRDTVLNYIDAGTLPAAKIGRKWKVREADLDQFIRNHRFSRSK
jgi:excisionase family DNA binding protein